MSDIHGCYNELLLMLDKIGLSDTDQLIMAGDYIDRGKNSYEVLKWIEHHSENVRFVRGNHEEEFLTYVNLMFQLEQKENLRTDFSSNKDAIALYKTVKYSFRNKELSASYFDLYHTINNLLYHSDVTLNDLCRWTEIIQKMPYYYELKVKDKTCIIVHAGYTEELNNINTSFSSFEEFCLYAREAGYQLGGKQHGMIIAGHTPTIVKGEFTYNEGNVFRYYDKEKDCIFYDIDCGCAFRKREPNAKLACIRLEDEKIFYV